jgi:hypothetical protein
MFLEGCTDACVNRIVGGDVAKRHAAQFGGETLTQRDDFHRHILPDFLFGRFSAKTGRLASKRTSLRELQDGNERA